MVSVGGEATPPVGGVQRVNVLANASVSARQRQASDDNDVFPSFSQVDQVGGDCWGSSGPLSSLTFGSEASCPGPDHPRGNVFSSSVLVGPQLPGSDTSISCLPTAPTSCSFIMGASFPFLSSPLSPPPSLSLPPSPPVVQAPASVSSSSSHHHVFVRRAVLGGDPFPFLTRSSSSSPVLYRTLGQWIASKGGRTSFCSWLGGLAYERLGPYWVTIPAQDIWEELILDESLAAQVETVLEQDVDVMERELVSLLSQAQHNPKPVAHVSGGKRTRRQDVPVFSVPSLTRCQNRNARRRAARLGNAKKRRDHQRRLACFRASAKYKVKRQGHLIIGTWNTRGLGAPQGKDPEGKLKSLFKVMSERKWSCALLSDVSFPADGYCEVTVSGEIWLVVHHGRVGVALNPFLARRWREGGSVEIHAKGWGDGCRAFGVVLPASGWKPGLLLVPVYAPLSTRTSLDEREAFREKLSHILDHSSVRRRLVVGGDFNGEVGATKDANWRHVLGPYGDTRRTKGGEELLAFCEQEQLVVAGTELGKTTRQPGTISVGAQLIHWTIFSCVQLTVDGLHQCARFTSQQQPPIHSVAD